MKQITGSILFTIALVIAVVVIINALNPKEAEATDSPFVGDAQCGSLNNQTVETLTGVSESDLCESGSAGNTPPTQTDAGWQWVCYDSAGWVDKTCNANMPVEEVIEPEIEVIEPIIEEVEEVTPLVEKTVTEPVRAIPTPVYVAPTPVVEVVEKKKKSSGSSKDPKLSKREIYEAVCGLPKESMPKFMKKWSDREVWATACGRCLDKEDYVTLRK